MPVDDIKHFDGPLPRIYEVDDNACCVIVMKVVEGNIIDITLNLNDAVPDYVIAAMLRTLARQISAVDDG